GHFQRGKRCPSVSVGKGSDRFQHFRTYRNFLSAKTARIVKRPPEKLRQLRRRKCLEHEDLAARKQSPVDFKGGVLRRRADEDDTALFHKRQKGVLLRLVKAVDLVYEQHRLAAEAAVSL